MADIEPPSPLAMVLCDRIILDHRNQQRSLIGVTGIINARKFPAMHPSLAVYLALAGGRGSMKCEFRLVRMGQIQPILQLPGQLNIVQHSELFEMDVTLQGLVFQQPGKYQVQFWANDSFLVDRLLVVREAPAPPEQQGQGVPPTQSGPPPSTNPQA